MQLRMFSSIRRVGTYGLKLGNVHADDINLLDRNIDTKGAAQKFFYKLAKKLF
jgi:hypothetical protein